MANTSKAKQKQLDLLAKLPPGTKKIQVKDEFDVLAWRTPDEVQDLDIIQLKKNGKPVVMRGAHGRPKTHTAPVTPAAKDTVGRKKSSLAQDPLLQIIKSDPGSNDILHQVIIGLAEETASLSFERQEAERTGRETSQLSIRRIKGLKATAEAFLQRVDLVGVNSLDLDSPGFKAAMQYVLETMKNAMVVIDIEPELMQTIYAKFGQLTKKPSWEAELKARVKSAK